MGRYPTATTTPVWEMSRTGLSNARAESGDDEGADAVGEGVEVEDDATGRGAGAWSLSQG